MPCKPDCFSGCSQQTYSRMRLKLFELIILQLKLMLVLVMCWCAHWTSFVYYGQ